MIEKSILESIPGIQSVTYKSPVTFLHGDNMDLLRWLKKEQYFKYFHIAIVDPPYGINVSKMNLGASKNSKPRTHERGDWDGSVPSREYWWLLNYCCRNVIYWGGNYFTSDNSNFTVVKFKDGEEMLVNNISFCGNILNIDGKEYSTDLIKSINTEKGIQQGRSFFMWDKYERGKSFADGELALTNMDASARVIQRGRTKRTEEDAERQHDTQKPVYLYDFLHLNCVEKNWRVLDTHGGSFSHAIAAYKNNVDLTIIDKCESYYINGISAYEEKSVKGRLF